MCLCVLYTDLSQSQVQLRKTCEEKLSDRPLGLVLFFLIVFLCACVLYVLTCLNYRINSVAFSPDGKLVASGSDDSTTKIWDISTGHCDSTLSVDWQSPDCESQILMVSSLLPLAICFLSGLHATDQTLNLREVNARINRHTENAR